MPSEREISNRIDDEPIAVGRSVVLGVASAVTAFVLYFAQGGYRVNIPDLAPAASEQPDALPLQTEPASPSPQANNANMGDYNGDVRLPYGGADSYGAPSKEPLPAEGAFDRSGNDQNGSN